MKFLKKINGIFENIPIIVEKKKIKNVHLKVKRDLTVTLSAPVRVNDIWINKFLIEKVCWINKHLEKFKLFNFSKNTNCLKNGGVIKMFGKEKQVVFNYGKNSITTDENNIYLTTQKLDDNELVTKIFLDWKRERVREVFQKELKIIFDKIFKNENACFPTLKIKKMSSMWGSCNLTKRVITLNEHLFKAEVAQIQYVILHELTHLKYRFHNKDFYNFLSKFMPDWKERKKILNSEIILF